MLVEKIRKFPKSPMNLFKKISQNKKNYKFVIFIFDLFEIDFNFANQSPNLWVKFIIS